MSRCYALFAAAALAGLLATSRPASADVKLKDYKTEFAVKSVAGYATAADTKKDADEFLKDVGDLVDAKKVKAGEGIEFKDGKLKWELPLATDKKTLSKDEEKKATEAVAKLLEAALKAEKDNARKLSATDRDALLAAKPVGVKGTPVQSGGLALDKFDTATAKATVAAYLGNATNEELAGVSGYDSVLDLDEIKKYPRVTYAGGVLTWQLQFKQDKGPENIDSSYKTSMATAFNALLKAALKAEKVPAKRLSDADIDKVAAAAKIEPAKLPKEIDVDTYVNTHLSAAVTDYIKENKDALKEIEKLNETKKAVDLSVPVRLTVKDGRLTWTYRRAFRKDREPLSLRERKSIEAALRNLVIETAKAEKNPARKLSEDMRDKLAQRLSASDNLAPQYVDTNPDTPLDEWTPGDVQKVVEAFLTRRAGTGASDQTLDALLTRLTGLGLSVNTQKDIDDLVYGLTYTKGGTPTFNWGYYAPTESGDMTDTRKAEITEELKKVLVQAFAQNQERTGLSLSQDDSKKVNEIIEDKAKTKIEFRAITEFKDLTVRDVREMVDDYLNQKAPSPEVAERLAKAKVLLKANLRYDLLLNDANMTLYPPEDKKDARFTWKVQAAFSRGKPDPAVQNRVKDTLLQLLVDAAVSPTRPKYKNIPTNIKAALLKALEAAEITIVASDAEDLARELDRVRVRLFEAEEDIRDLKDEMRRVRDSRGQAPPPPAGPQYVTKIVQMPYGVFGCRTRNVAVTVPLR